jgi:endonuclease-8
MPEGPEIKREADAISRVLHKQTLTSVAFGLPHLQKYEKKWKGALIQKVRPYSKAMTIQANHGQTLYSHNQLYGKWEVLKPGQPSKHSHRQKRVELITDKGKAILWSASEIMILPHEEVLFHPYIQKLGPDILNDRISQNALIAHFQKKTFANRPLSSLFLDQAFLAGIGNYLRTEILFYARLHPTLKPKDLSPAQIKSLAQAVGVIVQRAYTQKGVTTPPSQAKRITSTEAYTGKRFYIFARAAKPCPRCKTKIEKKTMAGRRIYLCPKCQKK